MSKATVTINLPNGDVLFLIDTSADESVDVHSHNCNIYRAAPSGEVVWQVELPDGIYERSSYTNMAIENDGFLHAHNWDGIEYVIDIETGKILLRRMRK